MAQGVEDLVGRATELGLLDGALAEVERSRPVAVALLGEPGIGKTRLLAELGERADERGALVLTGSASEFERDLPFWVFVDALDEYVQSVEPHRLAGLDQDDLGHVLPSLARDGRGGLLQAERYRTHRAVRALLEALARPKPLVLLLDDLHWADSGSIELLGGLLRRPPAGAVLIAFAVRPRQVPERLAGALERAHRAGGCCASSVGALSPEEAAALVGSDALYEQSGGNPFYLQQLARAPQRPAGAAPGERVARAAAHGRRGADRRAGAARGRPRAACSRAPRWPATRSSPSSPRPPPGSTEDEALEALDELLARDLVRPTDVPRRFRFRHPLVRRAVYEAAPGGWRLGAHERCAGRARASAARPLRRARTTSSTRRATATPRRSPCCARPARPCSSARRRAPRTGSPPRCGCCPTPRRRRAGRPAARRLARCARGAPAASRRRTPRWSTRSRSPAESRVPLIAACAHVEQLLAALLGGSRARLEEALAELADQASAAGDRADGRPRRRHLDRRMDYAADACLGEPRAGRRAAERRASGDRRGRRDAAS